MASHFVLLRHECPPEFGKPSHWDFMLQADGVLQTWELRELPTAWRDSLGFDPQGSNHSVVARRLPDHRLAYLEYEGPLTDNRGNVVRVDHGTYEVLASTDEIFQFVLQGKALQGTFRLQHIEGSWFLS